MLASHSAILSDKVNKPVFKIICFALFLSLFGNIATSLELGALKYIRFVTPIMLLVYMLYLSKTAYKHEQFVAPYFDKLIVFYLVFCVYTIIINATFFEVGFTYRNVVNIGLTLSPIITANAISKALDDRYLKKTIDFIFYGLLVSYLIDLFFTKGVSITAMLKIFTQNIITESDYETESGVSLVFGFYALFYLSQKEKKIAAIAIFATFLGAKRIAIFGLLTGIILYYVIYPIIGRQLKRDNKRVVTFSTIFSAICIVLANVWHLIASGEFNNFIEEVTGLHANQFFMGRLNRFTAFFYYFKEKVFPGMGYGLGYVENILNFKAGLDILFHNDFYRLFLEFGTVGFFIWTFILGRYNLNNRLNFSMLALLLILMQTDNIFLYDRVMYSYYIIFAYSSRKALTQ